MNATTILSNEHRVIEQVLSCLERIAEQAVAEEQLNGRAARRAIEFFRCFADHCHHGKEENLLFPKLKELGIPREGGPIGVMLDEHEQGRDLVRVMDEAIPLATEGNPIALEQFVEHAKHFVGLLRDHIHKEDRCLFPMARQVLSQADQQTLLEVFSRFEHDEMDSGTHDVYLNLANELADQMGVPRTATGVGGIATDSSHHCAGPTAEHSHRSQAHLEG